MLRSPILLIFPLDEGGHDDLGYYDDGRDLLADMHESNRMPITLFPWFAIENQYSPSNRIYSKHLEKKGKKIQNELDQQKQIQIDNIFRTSGSVPTYMSSTPNIPKSNVSSGIFVILSVINDLEEFDRIFEGMLNKQPSPQKRVLVCLQPWLMRGTRVQRKRGNDLLKKKNQLLNQSNQSPKLFPNKKKKNRSLSFLMKLNFLQRLQL